MKMMSKTILSTLKKQTQKKRNIKAGALINKKILVLGKHVGHLSLLLSIILSS